MAMGHPARSSVLGCVCAVALAQAAAGQATARAASQDPSAGHVMGEPEHAAGARGGSGATAGDASDPPPAVIDIDRRLGDLPALEDEPDLPPVLLREGSVISRVLGRVVVERATGAYVFVVDGADPLSPGHRLVLLPCARLSELERILASSTDYDFTFEITGDVFVFHERNYLLMTVPPLVMDHAPKASLPAQDLATEGEEGEAGVGVTEPGSAEPGSAEPGSAEPVSAEPGVPDQGSAESIISELERAVGSVAHRPESDATLEHAMSAGAQRLRAREGQTVVARRGHVRRSGGGAFIFVFDADATGRVDPPLTILPCLLLEEIEAYLRRVGDDAPMLLNGRIYSYGRFDYVVPAVFRIPFERTKLQP